MSGRSQSGTGAPAALQAANGSTGRGRTALIELDNISRTFNSRDRSSTLAVDGVNLDIGHFTAAGYDPVEYIREHHDRIVILHLKDRKRNKSKTEEDGASVAWGEGDTPIRAVLQLLKTEKYPIPAFIEYEHAGTADPVSEVKKAYEICKRALA
jgi:L-ribulose-5-phosphate 3-epimerase UlaE